MKPEQMDEPQPITVELRETLCELEFMNRYLGGHRYVRRFLQKRFTSKGKACRVLDLATGGGDFPRAIVDWARKSGVQLKVDAIDSGASIIDLAVRFSREYPEISYQRGDALTFDDGGRYDLVHCSLSLHHFEHDDAVKLLRHMRQLSRSFVLITDLEEGWMTTLGVGLVNRLLGHERMTIKDGDTSARRAYDYEDVEVLAKEAEWVRYEHERFLFCRQALWMEVREDHPRPSSVGCSNTRG
jgi:2-polyprenyl-3-methyl-5-hydroxy-6-metoxy-1,4-benzoquinol methylase